MYASGIIPTVVYSDVLAYHCCFKKLYEIFQDWRFAGEEVNSVWERYGVFYVVCFAGRCSHLVYQFA